MSNPNSGGNPNGQGGSGGNAPGSDKFDDKTQPLPPAAQKSPDGSEPSIAPDVSKPLVVRKIEDLLKEGKFTPSVEKQLGMTKDEAEQFVKKYEGRKQTEPAGPGQEIKVKPGQEKAIDKNYKGPEFNTNATVSARNQRTGTGLPQDNLGGLSQGGMSSPPPELRKQYEAYKKALSASKVGASTPAPAPSKP